MIKAIAMATSAIVFVYTIDWAVNNGYRDYLALPLIAIWAFTAVALIRYMRKGNN